MRHNSFAVFAAVFACLTVLPSSATTTMPRERVCPVGGEKYQSFDIASTSYYGIRLDGQRTGVGAHLPYVQCPNGFVVYKEEAEFTKEEIAKLTPVVASVEYQAIRQSEPVAARIVMLERALGKSDAEIRWWLFRAAFESEQDGENPVHRKYLEQAETAYAAFLQGHQTHDEEWWFSALRHADLLRQLGKFDESAAAVQAMRKAHDKEDEIYLKAAGQIEKHAEAKDAKPAAYEPDSD